MISASSAAVEATHRPPGADLVAAELARVDARIRDLLESREPVLSTIGRDLLLAGGKRARPALALLVFRALGGQDPTDTIDVSAALELIHSATLLHDDIIDSGQTRRGRPSPLVTHGTALTLVAGDFLFSRAFSVAGRFDAQIVAWAAEACVSLCEGEVLQQRFWRNPAVTVADHQEIAARKTASLFAQAARIGAHFAGASAEVVERARRFGHQIGIGFQMADDLLDVVGPAELIGKPVGSDLREGNPALPTILALPSLASVARVFADRSPSADDVAEALSDLRHSPVLAEVREMAIARIEMARRELAQIPQSPFRQALDGLAIELVARVR